MVRRRQRLFRFAVDTFIDLLQQVSGRKRIDYRCSVADLQSWDIFMDEYGISVGEDFIRKFILFGIQSWFNKSCEVDYSRQIRFNWVIGRNAIERWRKLGQETNMEIVQSCLKKDYDIKPREIRSEMADVVVILRKSEEAYKSEFHNTNKGFMWCTANTTLYFHKSPLCATCKFKTECKKLLKQEYPLIYKRRGYGE